MSETRRGMRLRPTPGARGGDVDAGSGPRRAGARGRVSFTLVLVFVSLVLAVEVFVLSMENRRLRAGYDVAPGGPGGPGAHADSAERALFVPGDVVDPFEVHGPTDQTVAVAFDGAFERTLLLVFAEDCGACALVLPDWRDVLATTAEGTRVVALQLDATGPTEADDERLPVVIHRPTGDVGLPLDKITKVPLTAVLDAAGMVTWVHYGTLDPRTIEGLRAAVR